MKLATFSHKGVNRIGVILESASHILDLAEADPSRAAFQSMQALIEAGPAGLDLARHLVERCADDPRCVLELSVVQLLAPVPRPIQIRDFSVFPGHIKNAPAGMARLAAWDRGDYAAAAAVHPLPEVPDIYRQRPIYCYTNRLNVVGPDSDIIWPRYSKIMDFELEFGIFIGKGGKNIIADDAADHIFGYTVYNDFTARDTQRVEMGGMFGPAKGKSFDCGNAMGPWIVTADELQHPWALTMAVRVNGETWATGTSAEMLHSFDEMIAFVSRDETLFPGEFFGSGTICNGCGLEQGRFLNHGDVVEVEVQGIGTLRNRVLRHAVSNEP